MSNRIFASMLALALATPALAAEPPTGPEKPKCECCAKMESEPRSCCCKKDKTAEEAHGEHKDHSAH